jgi:hypothetical protein
MWATDGAFCNTTCEQTQPGSQLRKSRIEWRLHVWVTTNWTEAWARKTKMYGGGVRHLKALHTDCSLLLLMYISDIYLYMTAIKRDSAW